MNIGGRNNKYIHYQLRSKQRSITKGKHTICTCLENNHKWINRQTRNTSLLQSISGIKKSAKKTQIHIRMSMVKNLFHKKHQFIAFYNHLIFTLKFFFQPIPLHVQIPLELTYFRVYLAVLKLARTRESSSKSMSSRPESDS